MRFAGFIAVIVCWLALSPPAAAGVFDDVGRAIEKATQDTGKAAEKAANDAQKTIEKSGEDAAGKLRGKVMAAQSTERVLGQLMKLPLDMLYALKVSPDICASGTVSCEVLPNDRVRQFLDIEIDRRKAALDYDDKSRTFWISLGSLIVSCCAFGLSALSVSSRARTARRCNA